MWIVDVLHIAKSIFATPYTQLHVTHIKYPFSKRQKTIELLQIIKISTTLHVYGFGFFTHFFTRIVKCFSILFHPHPPQTFFSRKKFHRCWFFQIISNIDSFNKPVCEFLYGMIAKKNYHRNHIGIAKENAQFLYASAFIKQTCQHTILWKMVQRQGKARSEQTE